MLLSNCNRTTEILVFSEILGRLKESSNCVASPYNLSTSLSFSLTTDQQLVDRPARRSPEKLRMSFQAMDTKGFGFDPIPASPSPYLSVITSIFGEAASPEASYCFKESLCDGLSEKEEKSWSFDSPLRQTAKRLCDESSARNGGGTKRNSGFDLNVVELDDDDEEEDARQKDSNCDSKVCLRGHWKPSEDAKLKELVAKFGPQNWNLIAESLEGRSGKSCRLRWFNQQDPKINKKPFSKQEEERLLSVHKIYGNKWALVARLSPDRTDNAVKNHRHMSARKDREQLNLFQRRRQLLLPNDTHPPTDSKAGRFSSLMVKISDPPCDDPWEKIKSPSGSNSTNSSVFDEPALMCTKLFLSPSSIGANSTGFTATRCLARKTEKVGSGGWKKFIREISAVDQVPITTKVTCNERSGPSEANSEISACDSAATEKNTIRSASRSSKQPSQVKSMKAPFIDFLGVGTA